jgi:hypothetical protein
LTISMYINPYLELLNSTFTATTPAL